jgi:hypothetical protein
MQRPPLFRARLLAGAFVCTLFALSPVQAEMLQFATADGVKSWPKLPDIPDWHQDQESSLRLSANSLIPDGVDFATADTIIQARGFPRRGDTAVSSLSQLMDNDRAAVPGAAVEKLSNIADKDGTPFTVYAFAPAPGSAGGWKAMAYSEEGDTLLAFTLIAKSKPAYDTAFPVFTQLIRRYAREIPW